MTGEKTANFREVMRRFATGVTVVTTSIDGKPKGLTANAFASVSAEPPMVLICVNRQARSHPIIAAAGLFCVNVLALEQADLARRFALKGAPDPFAEIPYHLDRTGSPVLDGSLAYLVADRKFGCALIFRPPSNHSPS